VALINGTVKYLLFGLEATPVVVHSLLENQPEDIFDKQPDPERFSLREVVCHLADWEGVWLNRMQKMVSEESPELPGYDEGQWAIDHNYKEANAKEQIAKFIEGRIALVAFLKKLESEQWQRTGIHSQWGPISILSLATLVIGHDGYHTKQIVGWLNA